jgi:octaprenyl-diphosphate synthase
VKAPTPLEALLKDRVALAVGGELRAIEDAIAAEIASSVPLVHEMGEFIAGAGGKRLRPILLLIAARLAGYQGPRAVRMGCVVELLHTATLIHDDVVDQAPLAPRPPLRQRALGRRRLHPRRRSFVLEVLCAHGG